jgi:hypothetical protein
LLHETYTSLRAKQTETIQESIRSIVDSCQENPLGVTELINCVFLSKFFPVEPELDDDEDVDSDSEGPTTRTVVLSAREVGSSLKAIFQQLNYELLNELKSSDPLKLQGLDTSLNNYIVVFEECEMFCQKVLAGFVELIQATKLRFFLVFVTPNRSYVCDELLSSVTHLLNIHIVNSSASEQQLLEELVSDIYFKLPFGFSGQYLGYVLSLFNDFTPSVDYIVTSLLKLTLFHHSLNTDTVFYNNLDDVTYNHLQQLKCLPSFLDEAHLPDTALYENLSCYMTTVYEFKHIRLPFVFGLVKHFNSRMNTQFRLGSVELLEKLLLSNYTDSEHFTHCISRMPKFLLFEKLKELASDVLEYLKSSLTDEANLDAFPKTVLNIIDEEQLSKELVSFNNVIKSNAEQLESMMDNDSLEAVEFIEIVKQLITETHLNLNELPLHELVFLGTDEEMLHRRYYLAPPDSKISLHYALLNPKESYLLDSDKEDMCIMYR